MTNPPAENRWTIVWFKPRIYYGRHFTSYFRETAIMGPLSFHVVHTFPEPPSPPCCRQLTQHRKRATSLLGVIASPDIGGPGFGPVGLAQAAETHGWKVNFWSIYLLGIVSHFRGSFIPWHYLPLGCAAKCSLLTDSRFLQDFFLLFTVQHTSKVTDENFRTQSVKYQGTVHC